MINITLQEFIQLADTTEYTALDVVPGKNVITGQSMQALPYSSVKYLIKTLPTLNSWAGMQQVFEICFDSDKAPFKETQFYAMGVLEYHQARNFITSSITAIIESEAKAFKTVGSEDVDLWTRAGADRLKPFDSIAPIIQLGQLLGQYPYDIGRKPYSEVNTLLIYYKIKGEVTAEFQKLKEVR